MTFGKILIGTSICFLIIFYGSLYLNFIDEYTAMFLIPVLGFATVAIPVGITLEIYTYFLNKK